MSTHLRALVEAVRRGRGRGLVPPLRARGPGRLAAAVELRGPAAARALAELLAAPRFAPLADLLAAIDEACRAAAARHARVLAPGLVAFDHAPLVGPVVTEALIACARCPAARARALVRQLGDGFCAALRLFVERLARDVGGLSRRRGVRATALIAHMEETHHGRQFVIEVALGDGSRWAYKPRPCDGESVVLGAERSVFALINRLRPASGEPRLPTLAVRRGRGADRDEYGWLAWVRPPRAWGIVRRDGAHRLAACRLSPREAARFWYRAGCLAAASVALGITDVHADNVRIGQAPDDAVPLAYPVDLEMIGYPVRGLRDTGLVGPPGDGGNHHVGFERLPRWCTVGGPLAAFVWRGDRLALDAAPAAWMRDHAPALVVDRLGRAGYAPYLPWLVRGMFDTWVTLVQRKAALRRLLARAPSPRVRVAVRPTTVYSDHLDRLLTGRAAPRVRPPWSREEAAQLARLDVPYFARRVGEPLAQRAARGLTPVGPQPLAAAGAPVPLLDRLERLDLAPLGEALRDAVAFVHADLVARVQLEPRARVALALGDSPDDGAIELPWPEAERTVRIAWRGADLSIALAPLAPVAPVGMPAARPAFAREARRRLLQLDRLDRALRERWQRGQFRDRALERQLDALTAAGVTWLDAWVRDHGLPGRALVGERASGAACRLVQHADQFPAFQARYLTRVRDAVARGELAPRHLAYLTDQVAIRRGKPQRYGTKFRRHHGELAPFPIADPARVDARRAAVGLPPLARYAAQLRRLFDRPGGSTA